MSLLPVTVLRRARKLIENRSSWIKGAFIAKRKGVQCYCAQGALATAAGIKIISKDNLSDVGPAGLPQEYYDAHQFLIDALAARGGETWVPGFNDDRNTDHATVLQVFDKAIELAKA